ncbi:hypothetical protein [Psychromonas sp. psych-6C06]|uniref:hypothetical protein n=1 Tax=Psychromonas sp. psych-6C06 TaxID=2058089 RepID=UPI0012907BA8|nr:hypothetical protein [Psychromonas sp. psych-6C06]
MKRKIKSLLILAVGLSLIACSSRTTEYLPLSSLERQNIVAYKLNHRINNECVSQQLSAIDRKYCDDEISYCGVPAYSFFTYQQWLALYQSCVSN